MATRHWVGKISTVIVGTLLHLELSALIMTKPAQSQSYPGQPQQPAVVPMQPHSGQLPVVDSFSPQPGANQLVPVNSSATPTSPRFTFTSVLEYSNCLESVLQLYQNPGSTELQPQNSCAAQLQQIYHQQGLTKSQALELISGANFYATNLLERQIFPPRGQRRRVAQLFKFIYQVDANDTEMHQLATQS